MNDSTTTPLSEESEKALWIELREKNCSNTRLILIDNYLPLAHQISAKLYLSRTDDFVEFSDYYHYALVGLIESVDRFLPDRETRFSTFATYRIRGAILNGVTKASESREQIAFRLRIRKERLESLSQDDEGNDLFGQMVELTTGLAIGYMLEDSGMTIESDRQEVVEPPGHYGIEQIKARLHNVVDQLPERERLIVKYHYFHHISFEEISDLLNVSKGRISQIHKKILNRCREELREKSEIDSLF